MGIAITAAGVDASENAIGFILPIDMTGLEYLNYFGGDATRTARNLADGGDPGIVVGSPTYDASDTLFTPGTNYVQTTVTETADKTIIAVVNPQADANGTICGNYRGNRVGDAGVLVFSNAMYYQSTTGGDGKVTPLWQDGGWNETPGSASSSVAISIGNSMDVGSWYCLAGRTASNVRKIFNKTTSQSATSGTTTTVDIASSTYQVGSMPNSAGFTSPPKIAFLCIFNRALTDSEIDTMYTTVKAYLAGLDTPITI